MDDYISYRLHIGLQSVYNKILVKLEILGQF